VATDRFSRPFGRLSQRGTTCVGSLWRRSRASASEPSSSALERRCLMPGQTTKRQCFNLPGSAGPPLLLTTVPCRETARSGHSRGGATCPGSHIRGSVRDGVADPHPTAADSPVAYVSCSRIIATQLISTTASGKTSSVTPTAVHAGYGSTRNSAATLSRALTVPEDRRGTNSSPRRWTSSPRPRRE
jgi:hypothetical protein